MASDILHIKDSFYFEVPRALWPANYRSANDFYSAYGPWVIRNSADYQQWEAEKIVEDLRGLVQNPGHLGGLVDQWKDWQHEKHSRVGRPLDQYIDDEMTALQSKAANWAKRLPEVKDATQAYLAEHPGHPLQWMYQEVLVDPKKKAQWEKLRVKYDSAEAAKEYIESPGLHWSETEVAAYNKALSGKIFIPQPFATLRNGHEVQSGFGISKFMVIEIVVAVLMVLLFKWLAGKVGSSNSPKGKLWNLLESMVLFVRNKIVVPAMGEHDADHYMPLMWTLFFFILGLNLMGMIPWIGAPTSSFAVTGALALLVLAVGMVQGIRHFGVAGYLKNLCPSLGLPMVLAVFIVPLVWVIEAVSLFIKHGVLAVRLLANMVAGHLVLLGFLGIGFGLHAVSHGALAGVISVVSATLLSFLELFVAFLQAYIFTFLASMFIGSATHHH